MYMYTHIMCNCTLTYTVHVIICIYVYVYKSDATAMHEHTCHPLSHSKPTTTASLFCWRRWGQLWSSCLATRATPVWRHCTTHRWRMGCCWGLCTARRHRDWGPSQTRYSTQHTGCTVCMYLCHCLHVQVHVHVHVLYMWVMCVVGQNMCNPIFLQKCMYNCTPVHVHVSIHVHVYDHSCWRIQYSLWAPIFLVTFKWIRNIIT